MTDGEAKKPSKPRTMRMTRADRAEPYFAIYCALGMERSLKSVAEVCQRAGMKIGLRTLETYSRDYDWPARAVEWDAKRQRGDSIPEAALALAIANDVLHAELGKTLVNLSLAHARAQLKEIEEADAKSEWSGQEVARVGDVGVRVSRLAAGQATEKRDVMISLASLVTSDLAILWQKSIEAALSFITSRSPVDESVIEGAFEQAASIYGPGADRLLQSQFRAAGINDVIVGEQGMVEEEDD